MQYSVTDMVYEEILLYHNEPFKAQYMKKVENNKSVIDHILVGQSSKIIDPEADDDFPV
jgi:mitogen-activated protein kinase 1/3